MVFHLLINILLENSAAVWRVACDGALFLDRKGPPPMDECMHAWIHGCADGCMDACSRTPFALQEGPADN